MGAGRALPDAGARGCGPARAPASRGVQRLALGAVRRVFGKPRNTVADETAMERAPGQLGDAVPEAAQHVVERQQHAPAELDHDGLLGFGQGRGARFRRPHRSVGRAGPLTPLQDGLGVDAVPVGNGPKRRLRFLELGSKRAASFGRCRGARLPSGIFLLTGQGRACTTTSRD